jgi:NAD(P)H-hydrate epimerase
MKLVSVEQMQAIEKEANEAGLTYAMMMENAGRNLAREVLKLSYAQDEDEEGMQVLGLVGSGNNGGDTLIALANLAEKGWIARAYLVGRKPGEDPLVKRLEQADGEIYRSDKDEDRLQLQAFLESADVLLDGVLGTGFKLPLRGEAARVLAAVRDLLEQMEWPPLVVAVDCPSGVDCDSGEASPQAIQADATVTMAAVKQGLLKLPAYELVGELRLVGIGALENLKTWQSVTGQVADDEQMRLLLPQRPADAHKGTFGTVLVAAGSINYTGAAYLAGKAAYRIGAGLVTLAVPAPIHAALAGQLPEATWVLLPHEMGVIAAAAADVLLKNLERVTTLLVGPGLGLEDTTGDFLQALLKAGAAGKSGHNRLGFVRSGEAGTGNIPSAIPLPPLVVDADGLKLLARLENWPGRLPAMTVLTPHPGEMAVLTGLNVETIQQDRQGIAARFAKAWGHVVVLKGAFTVIAAPDGDSTTIPVATPGLARAGSGDVLAGVIAGLRAQGVGAYEAAVAGTWIHARAGLAATDMLGNSASVLAGDLLETIPDILAELL